MKFFSLPMRVLCLPLLLLLAQPTVSLACSPPAPTMDAGFYRGEVSHLPRNARGVMFFLPSKKPRVSDFRITSPDDKRPLVLRVNNLKNDGFIRLEPIGGFAPAARYEFKYVPGHARWSYPDRISVTIDDVVVDTAGTYAIELASQPEVRMIVVPGSPACTQPAVTVTQPFSYRIPASVASYRAALEYGSAVRPEPLRSPDKKKPELYGWEFGLSTYYATVLGPYDHAADEHYTGADDIIATACGQQRLRGQLSGRVAFPEVDDKVYPVAPVSVDLGRNVLGQCRPLDALTRTMHVYGAEKALKTMCGRTYLVDDDAAQSDAAARTDEFERRLGFLYDLSPTCELATLAHVAATRQYLPDRQAMARFGAALDEALRFADGVWRSNGKRAEDDPIYRQTIDGLDYLMWELPKDLQPHASAMLVPLLPRLTAHLAEPKSYRPDTVAALIARAGCTAVRKSCHPG